jgi:hypothetical protein
VLFAETALPAERLHRLITHAKRVETLERRLNQMLDELEKGDVYMKMAWQPKRG